jgi:hypothetical protein
MPAIVKPSGPSGATRPFLPVATDKDPAERIAHALEHIAVVLSAIDHNLDVVATQLTTKKR